MPSPEYSKLVRMNEPTTVRPGDLYRQRCGIMLVLGHARRSRYHSNGHTWCWYYHMGSQSLGVSPKELRDHDSNAYQAEKWIDECRKRGEECVYVGNLFEMAPITSLGLPVDDEIGVPRRQE